MDTEFEPRTKFPYKLYIIAINVRREKPKIRVQIPSSKILQIGKTYFIVEDLWNVHPVITSEIVKNLVEPIPQELPKESCSNKRSHAS